METLALLILASGTLSLFCLLLLHFVSPEYQISWRMISEYALGKYKGLITAFFILWGICSFLLCVLLWNEVSSFWAMLGIVLIFISGAGALMGGLFDIKHKLHGLSFGLGVPTLPIGALLVSYHLIGKDGWSDDRFSILLSTHSIWISMLLMAVSMVVLISGFKKAGFEMGPNVEAPKELPKGVIGVSGYFNRLLVLCYIGWQLWMAKVYLTI